MSDDLAAQVTARFLELFQKQFGQKQLNFNPNHDELGRFAESPGGRNYRGLGPDGYRKIQGEPTDEVKEFQNVLDRAAAPIESSDPPQKEAFKKYTETDHYYVNKLLRGDSKSQSPKEIERTQDLIAAMDQVFDKASLDDDIITYRGITSRTLGHMDPEAQEALMTPGSEIRFDGFISTSARADEALSFAGEGDDEALVCEIKLPKGSKAVYVAPVSAFPNEMEVLVNRGTKFRVLSGPRTENISTSFDRSFPVRVVTLEAIV
ncbi:MAG: ADP-ribosyltransferase exoenzyme [Methanosaeta sp. PtaU1.Bin060]|nr:MAG: ADP-ribosyltransferase exoenzyme [Methanosaeta sp. PtaU1.Bin060]